jgi:hypothetical protein
VDRRQHEQTKVLIATAESNGQFSIVAMHRRVDENLGRVIAAFTIEEGGPAGG